MITMNTDALGELATASQRLQTLHEDHAIKRNKSEVKEFRNAVNAEIAVELRAIPLKLELAMCYGNTCETVYRADHDNAKAMAVITQLEEYLRAHLPKQFEVLTGDNG